MARGLPTVANAETLSQIAADCDRKAEQLEHEGDAQQDGEAAGQIR